MTTQPTTPPSTPDKVCPYCGKPYPIVTIPGLWDIPERTIQSSSCGCEGEREASQRLWQRYKIEDRERILRKVGIPKRYWDIPEDTTHLEAIGNGGLFIHGLVGRGKTWLAVATLKGWMNRNRGKRAVFTDMTAFFANIRKSYDSGESESESMWRYAKADLLVLDDFGKGRQSEWALERVETIVQARYEDVLPTVFTSQWAGADLIARLSQGGSEESATAIVSRIVQTCKMVELDGPDRRMA